MDSSDDMLIRRPGSIKIPALSFLLGFILGAGVIVMATFDYVATFHCSAVVNHECVQYTRNPQK